MEEKLLEVSVVAVRLGVSPVTVYRLLVAGKLERRRVGVSKGYRVPESSLARFLEASAD